MIQKLKRKFVFINMLSVSIILITAFILVGVTNYSRQQHEFQDILERTMAETDRSNIPKIEIGNPKADKRFNPSTTFWVSLDSNSSIITTATDNIEITGENLNAAIADALDSSSDKGYIRSLNLYFLKKATPEGSLIVFLDVQTQVSSFHTLILTLCIYAVFGLCAFFLISVYLAKWSIKPVAEAWDRQRQFIADASHELKTPLTVILANTGIILNHRQDTIESQQKWILFVKDEAERMKKLVEDMLFLAKSDASKLPTIKSELNMSDLVWSASLPFESIAFEQGLVLESEIAPDIKILGNEKELKQLIGIMLDNACKYASTKGSVTIRLYKSDKIHLSVHNTGGSITQEQQKHLFERFYRTDESRDRKAGGYGLGLAIAKSIIDHHHGKAQVKSSVQTGTVFEISF